MSYTAPQSDGQLSRVHSTALREAIGERLCYHLDLDLTDTPPHLLQLLKQFQQAG